MSRTTRVSSPMDEGLRPRVKVNQPLAATNRNGNVIGYSDGDDTLDNLCEPSYPASLAWEGWPERYKQAGVAGKKLKDPEGAFGSMFGDDDAYSTVHCKPGSKKSKGY